MYEGLSFVRAGWKFAGRCVFQRFDDRCFPRAVRSENKCQRTGETDQRRLIVVIAEVPNTAKRQPSYFRHLVLSKLREQKERDHFDNWR